MSQVADGRWSILDPNQVPEIRGVTKYVQWKVFLDGHIWSLVYRFPAQEHVSGSSKIPTVLYYDQYGAVQAIGAETLTEGIYEMAEDAGWIRVEWFIKFLPQPQSIN